MKIQRKLLTEEQQKKICNENTKGDDYIFCGMKCPLRTKIGTTFYCTNDIKVLEQKIKDYWNEEIEIEEECL